MLLKPSQTWPGDYSPKLGNCPQRVLSHNIGSTQGHLDAIMVKNHLLICAHHFDKKYVKEESSSKPLFLVMSVCEIESQIAISKYVHVSYIGQFEFFSVH